MRARFYGWLLYLKNAKKRRANSTVIAGELSVDVYPSEFHMCRGDQRLRKRRGEGCSQLCDELRFSLGSEL
jgi:hypothetical protein